MSRNATPVALGEFGVFAHRAALTPERAARIEELGYGAVWIGGSPPADLAIVEDLLAATSRLTVATGIVNIWDSPAAETAESYHRVEAAHPGRFLLGIGAGHREHTDDYRRPYQALVDYLDALDEHAVPADRRVLAALGPRVLALAAQRSAGAHPYLVPVPYTRAARGAVGDVPLLAVEHKTTLGSDPVTTRGRARPGIDQPYLHLRNYRDNLVRLGWPDADLDGGGSDALIDALAAQGDPPTAAAGLRAHLDAGADHVAVHTLPGEEDPLPTLAALAPELGLSAR